jgi:protocatechuate 3,4-dioxygenase beta subunit
LPAEGKLQMSAKEDRLSRRALMRLGLTIPPMLLAACTAPTLLNQTPGPAPAEATTAPGPEGAQLPTVTPTPATVAQAAEPAATTTVLPPTPACDDGDEPTPAQTEGPYYTPDTPQRNSFLEAGVTGTKMIVTGYVLSTDCRPIAQAMLDFWHCDDAGVYDNTGYRLRGHFFSDDQGHYTLETIMPGVYPGRTRHFHVKVQAPNQSILTTQLYFPGEPQNQSDGIFRPECLLDVQDVQDGKLGSFNFVLQLV